MDTAKPIHIPTVSHLHQLMGFPAPEHPLFSIIRAETIGKLPINSPINFSLGFYTIALKRNLKGYIQCGRRPYDFDKGTMMFISPNQLIGHGLDASEDATGWLLFFQPELLAGHTLNDRINQFGFFDYAINEALHLSAKEEKVVEEVFHNIQVEYDLPIDQYSRSVILSNIELLLTYANRFYGRQFITRNDVESSFLITFNKTLRHHLQDPQLEVQGIPSVELLASQMHVSPKYLSDKLKVLTGKNTQEHIHSQLLEKAKNLLGHSQLSVSEVAYQLGFEYPQYFSRLFKKKIGMSPKAYRQMN